MPAHQDKNLSLCYHDSGASHHIFSDRSIFENYRAIDALPVKGFGSTLTTSAIGIGDMYIKSTCQGRSYVLKLSNVLHVPTARLNLVSQGRLERKSIHCHSGDGRMSLFMNGDQVVQGRLTPNNLFLLDMTPFRRLPNMTTSTPSPSLADRLTSAISAASEGEVYTQEPGFTIAY